LKSNLKASSVHKIDYMACLARPLHLVCFWRTPRSGNAIHPSQLLLDSYIAIGSQLRGHT
jgi:hypothetical protein